MSMARLARRLLAAFYPQEVWPTLAAHGVFPLDTLPWLVDGERLPLVAGTAGLAAARPPIDAVVASTCIDHAEADPHQLSAAVLADLVHGAVVSRALDLPLLSFLGTGEEMRLTPGGDARAPAWGQVADVIAEMFARLRLPARSRIIVSHEEQVWSALQATVASDRERLPRHELAGLYHLTDGSLFPLGTPFDSYYEYYRSTLAHYRQPVLERLLGCALRGILVVENVQQVKAVALARRLNGGMATEHLVTLPAPGRTGTTRATRAGARGRLCLDELQVSAGGLAQVSQLGLVGDPLLFWRTVCQLWNDCSA